MKVFECKMCFHYTGSFYSSSENILLSGYITVLCYSVQIIEVTVNKRMKRRLSHSALWI